jgi:predicted aspartyl protease
LDSKKPIGIGPYDQTGNACLKLHMRGVKHAPPGAEFEAIIDTGFTGFIQLPLSEALSLSLPLEGTNSVTLANGSSLVMLTALAQVTLMGRTEVGVVLLSMTSNDILVGMDFLRRFDRALVVSKKVGVILVEEAEWSAVSEGREESS